MRPADINRVVHLEIHTGDLPGARAFYAELCGWTTQRIDTRHGSYLALALGDGLGDGIVECPIDRALWLPYVEVAEIGAATDRARLLGASVLLEPRESPAGWRSVALRRRDRVLARQALSARFRRALGGR
jgi:predicted enzyme related to lactoylglutathione lyase